MKAVVGVDGSHAAMNAVRAFLQLAKSFTAPPDVRLVAVVDYADVPGSLGKAPLNAPDLLAEDAATALAMATELCSRLDGNVQEVILRGHVIEQILQYSGQFGANLIVVGTHGRKGVRRAVLGSTCENILRNAEIPVLAVRHALGA